MNQLKKMKVLAILVLMSASIVPAVFAQDNKNDPKECDQCNKARSNNKVKSAIVDSAVPQKVPCSGPDCKTVEGN
jgi:hypothetical protein